MRVPEAHRLPAGLVAFGLLCCAGQVRAQDAAGRTLYVDAGSRGGPASDDNPGTRERPWQSALKAFREARPGDTVLFRGGTYRLPRTVHTSDFAPGTPSARPITFRNAPGERAVVTNLRPVPAGDWTRLEVAPGKVVYTSPAGKGFRVSNVVEDGVPLKRAHSGDANVLADTPLDAIAGPGEWCSSIREGRVSVRTRDDRPPGDRVEICDVGGFGASGNLICLTPGDSGPGGWPRLVFEGLTFETGFHGLLIRTGSVVVRDCVLRKSFGDLLNGSAGRVTVEGCQFYAFGESAIDVTGAGARSPEEGPPPPTLIRGCCFHDSVVLRSPGQKGVNGVMIKGGAADVVVDGCEFRDLQVHYGALTLGGASGGGRAGEGIDLVARNNVFREVSGPYVVLFAGSRGCRFVNNLVTGARVEDLVRISRAKSDDPETGNTEPWVLNNLLFRNGVTGGVVSVSPGAATGVRIDHNLLFESGTVCRLEGETVALADLPDRGCQARGVAVEPRFRDAGRFDFRPAPGSPVLGAGADLGKLVPNDFSGAPRPAGACAIGPYEGR